MSVHGGNIGSRPIDRGWSWMVVLGASVAMFFFVGGIRSLGILLVEFVSRFNASSALASLMIGLVAAGMSLIAPFANILGSHIGFRYVMIVGGFMCSSAFFLTSVAPNIGFVIAVFGVLLGIGYGCLFGPALCSVGLYFEKRRSMANGLAVAGGSVGQLVIPLFTRFIIDEYGFTWGLILFGAFSLNIIPAALLMRTESYWMPKHRPEDAEALKAAPVAEDINQNGVASPGKHQYKMLHERESDHLDKINGHPAPYAGPESPGVGEEKSPMLHEELRFKIKHGDGVKDHLMHSTSSLHSLKQRFHDSISDLRQTLDEKYVSTRSLDIVALEQNPPGITRQNMALSTENISRGCCSRKKKTAAPEKEGKKLMDWSLLKNYLFIIYIFGNCLGNAGYINACLYLPPHAEDIGINKNKAAFLLAIVGITDLAGRIFGGWFSDLGLVKRSNIMAICMMLTGIGAIACMISATYGSLVVLSCILGCIGGFFVSLIAVVLVDFLGLAKMAQAMGISLMIQGLFNIFVPTTLGILRDVTGTYTYGFYICGTMMIMSAFFFALEPCARRWEEGPASRKAEDPVGTAIPGEEGEEEQADDVTSPGKEESPQKLMAEEFAVWERMDRESVL